MKKVLFALALMLMGGMAYGQRVMNVQHLKTTDLGNQRLEAAIDNGDTTYVITLATGNRFQKRISFVLGDKERALKLLQWMYDYEPRGGDIIDLENPSDNAATYSGINGYTIYSEGRQLKGHLRKQNIRGFIKTIKEYAGIAE